MRAIVWFAAVFIAASAWCGETSAENKAIARRIFDEVLTQGHFERAADLYAPTFVNHGVTRDVSLDVDQAAARGWVAAFPDLQIVPEIVVAEGDLVALLWRATGTNTGTGNGLPPTGRKMNERGVTIWRVKGGKVIEEWSAFSETALMKHLGLNPGGSAASSERPLPERSLPKVSARERQRNAAIVRSAIQRATDGDWKVYTELYDPHFVDHGLNGDRTRDDEAAAARPVRGAASVTMTIADGDLVAASWLTAQAGAAPGRDMAVFRLAGGRIVEQWSVSDVR